MSTISVIAEDARDLGDMARAIQWAQLLVDAALPLDPPAPDVRPGTVPVRIEVVEEDRTGFRLEAFSQVLAQLIEGGWTARPSDLDRLVNGQMPEARP
jgi:hypothetical protein